MADSIPTPEQLVPAAHWYHLDANNWYLDVDKFSCAHPQFVYILQGHPLWYAITEATACSQVYMQQFWYKIKKQGVDLVTTIDRTKVTLTKELFREILHLPNVDHYEGRQSFDPDATPEQICADIRGLGYEGPLNKTNYFKKSDLCEPWQALFSLINKCLSPKHAGHDRANFNIMSIFHGVAMNRHCDFTSFIWNDFVEAVKTKDHRKSGKVMPYLRFTGLIVKRFQDMHEAIYTRSGSYRPPKLQMFRQFGKLPDVVPKVIPLALLNLADQTVDHIRKYRLKYYDGDNLRAQPLADDEISAPRAGNNDDDQPLPPPPPDEQASKIARRVKMRHDRPPHSDELSPSSQRRFPRTPSTPQTDQPSCSTPQVRQPCIVLQAPTPIFAIPISSVAPPPSLIDRTSKTTEAEIPISSVAPTPIFETGGSSQSQDDVDYDAFHISSPVPTSSVPPISVSPIVSDILASLAESYSIPVHTSVISPARGFDDSENVQFEFENEIPQVSVDIVLPTSPVVTVISSTTTTSVALTSTVAASTVAMPPAIYTQSTTSPISTRRPPVLSCPSSSSSSLILTTSTLMTHLEGFEQRLEKKFEAKSADSSSNLDNKLQTFKDDLIREFTALMKSDVASKGKSVDIAEEEEEQPSEQPVQVPYKELSLDEMKSALFTRFALEYPRLKATSLIEFLIEEDRCKQAALKRKHDDQDDPDQDDPHEAERRRRLGGQKTDLNQNEPKARRKREKVESGQKKKTQHVLVYKTRSVLKRKDTNN